MLLLPLVLGVTASRLDPWQGVLAVAAVSGYVSTATIQAWTRARRPPAYRAPILVWGTLFAVSALALAAAFPALLLCLLVILPSSAVVLLGARPGYRRDALNSLAQVAQALVLVPAAAVVSGAFAPAAAGFATLVAAVYLVGSVLVVRSVLSERGNARFAGLAITFHGVVAGLALVGVIGAWLPLGYAAVAAWLLLRAVGLPALQARWAGGSRRLRPVHVGVVEIVSSALVILASLAAIG